MNAAWASSPSTGGASVRDAAAAPTALKERFLPGWGALAKQPCRLAGPVPEGVWRVGRNVGGFTRLGHEMLVAKADLDLTLEDCEHFLEIVMVRVGAYTERDVHVDEGVLAGGVVAGNQDRVGVADKAKVSKGFVVVGSCDGKVSMRVIGRYRTLRRCGWGRSSFCSLCGRGGAYASFARSRVLGRDGRFDSRRRWRGRRFRTRAARQGGRGTRLSRRRGRTARRRRGPRRGRCWGWTTVRPRYKRTYQTLTALALGATHSRRGWQPGGTGGLLLVAGLSAIPASFRLQMRQSGWAGAVCICSRQGNRLLNLSNT